MQMKKIHTYDEMYRFNTQKFHINNIMFINNINLKCIFVINIKGNKDVFWIHFEVIK